MQVATVDYRAADAGQQFCTSLKNTGFAVIRNHAIDPDLVQHVYDEWAVFFKSNDKEQYLLDKEKQDGYVPMSLSETAKGHASKDLKEFYHLYFPWGRYPSTLSDSSKRLFQDLYSTAQHLLQWVEDHTPKKFLAHLKAPLSQAVDMKRSLFRIINYPALSGQEDSNALRAAAHEDINLLTLLNASTEPGLQVKDANEQWHDVGYGSGDLIINAGDMLQECTNHYYRSTTHRVIKPKGSHANIARMSMPLFLHPYKDYYLSENYSTADHYLQERLSELGLVQNNQ